MHVVSVCPSDWSCVQIEVTFIAKAPGVADEMYGCRVYGMNHPLGFQLKVRYKYAHIYIYIYVCERVYTHIAYIQCLCPFTGVCTIGIILWIILGENA